MAANWKRDRGWEFTSRGKQVTFAEWVSDAMFQIALKVMAAIFAVMAVKFFLDSWGLEGLVLIMVGWKVFWSCEIVLEEKK